MELSVENRVNVPGKLADLSAVAEFVLRREEVQSTSDISLALVSLVTMRELNKKYRSIDAPTDVLAFNLSEDAGLAGEVVIAPEVAADQARANEFTVAQEMRFLVIHGLLHLLGYDHETEEDAKNMFERQDWLMQEFEASAGAV